VAAARSCPPPFATSPSSTPSSSPYTRLWEARERERVTQSIEYFIRAYGHVQPPQGAPIPFDLWPEQADTLHDFQTHRLVLVLKARQLGLTWLALHLAYHLMAFDESTPRANILALSKRGDDASKLLERLRRIHVLLPPFLRQPEDATTRGSKREFRIQDRGRAVSLPATPDAARSETATLALVDEAGHTHNANFGPTWTALLPTLGETGRALIIGTGNGDEDTPGAGQAFATLVRRAERGESDLHLVFLPASVDPARTPEWRDQARRSYIDEEDFYAENPETIAQALIGKPTGRVYPPAGIDAAVDLGRELDAMLENGTLAAPADGCIHIDLDWGEHTHGLLLWALEGGGLYIPPGEVVAESTEASKVTDLLHANALRYQRIGPDGRLVPPIGRERFDAAGAQVNKTFVARARAKHSTQWAFDTRSGRHRVRPSPVPFGKYKDATKDYLRWLFNRTANDEPTAVIAISPQNPELIRQLRGLTLKDDGSGKIDKEGGDDHGPDALIAGAAPIAARHYPRTVHGERGRLGRLEADE
jgi:hypothetical protein